MCMRIYIYIYTVCICIYMYGGEARGSPEHRGTLGPAIQKYMSDLLIYSTEGVGGFVLTSFELR